MSGRRTISALMCANWEGTSIVPDICVPAGEALRPAAWAEGRRAPAPRGRASRTPVPEP
ncbi:hypothetical protein GCM10020000_03130 [Streptomyces olivoverticillatus]